MHSRQWLRIYLALQDTPVPVLDALYLLGVPSGKWILDQLPILGWKHLNDGISALTGLQQIAYRRAERAMHVWKKAEDADPEDYWRFEFYSWKFKKQRQTYWSSHSWEKSYWTSHSWEEPSPQSPDAWFQELWLQLR